MAQGSRIIDVRQTGRVWSSTARSIPDTVTTPTAKSLEAVSLPNSSLCADFLVGGGNVWAGVAVGIGKADLPLISELFQLAMPTLVKIIVPEQAAKLERYKRFPNWGWLEVLWLPVEELRLVEVQTNGVLWYELAGRVGSDRRIVAVGLEDLAHLVAEADEELIIPVALADIGESNEKDG